MQKMIYFIPNFEIVQFFAVLPCLLGRKASIWCVCSQFKGYYATQDVNNSKFEISALKFQPSVSLQPNWTGPEQNANHDYSYLNKS